MEIKRRTFLQVLGGFIGSLLVFSYRPKQPISFTPQPKRLDLAQVRSVGLWLG